VDLPFNKVLHFSLVFTALAGALLYLRATHGVWMLLGVNTSSSTRRRQFLSGFCAGILILVSVEITLHLLGMRQPDPDLQAGAAAFLLAVLKALLSGLLVGLIEELTYRGAILEGFMRHSLPTFALLLSSLLYAAVHFIELPDTDPQSGIHWYSGVLLLGRGFHPFQDPGIWDSFTTLFLLGLLLCQLRLHTGKLIACIGLHAGIVAMNKILAYSTDYRDGSPWASLVNLSDQPNGHLASGYLLLCLMLYHYLSRARLSGDNIFPRE